jgi:retron-type reverse transcriptase
VQSGRRIVVDVDLEKVFDRVNHDILIDRLGRTITDRRIIRLVRPYLDAGIMDAGIVQQRVEGTPQGGPPSPLLANVLLARWTRNWSAVATPSSAVRMMRTSMSAAARRASGSCGFCASSTVGCA